MLLVDDPLGLSRLELPVPAAGAVLVRPRVPQLGLLFSDAGSRGDGGRRQPVRRPSGLEPHGVREYVEGEPLRAVHWATSARRGQLMVRELEDAPRDSVAVLLDVERSSIAGPPGDSSLDDAVRAAAGLVRAHAARLAWRRSRDRDPGPRDPSGADARRRVGARARRAGRCRGGGRDAARVARRAARRRSRPSRSWWS